MKRANILALLLAIAALAGCSDDFVSEEMLLGDENKLRPLAVVCEPAEVSPGDPVTVTFTYWDPHPDETSIDWKVALDFDEGLYGAAPTERNYLDLEAAGVTTAPVNDGNGFMTQTFTWIVPTDVLSNTSAIPENLDQEPWLSLSQIVAPGQVLTRQELDAALAAIDPLDLIWLTEEEKDPLLDLADLFACRVRFRAEMRGGITLDVTRNLTVRHSRRLGSWNVNENTELAKWILYAVPAPDVDFDDLDDYADELLSYPLTGIEGEEPTEVPRHSDWTYYLSTDFVAQLYTSPFSGDEKFAEIGSYRWYSFRLDDGDRGHPLLRNDDGDEAEMWEMDKEARLVPPTGGESEFRVYLCVRDERPEWSGSQGVPGAVLRSTEIRFVTP